jgi:hypothetical protein
MEKVFIFYFLTLFMGCNSPTDLATGQVNSSNGEAIQANETSELAANAPRISTVQIRDQTLLIGGSNLSGIDQISLENDTVQVDLRPSSQNDTQLVADAGAPFKSLGLVSGAVYSLTLVDSTNSQSVKIEMTYLPQD